MKKFSFSKIILALIMSAYFVVLGAGIYIVIVKSPDQLYTLFTFVGGPVAVIVPFYLKKAERENTKGGITYDAAMRNIAVEEDEAD